MHQESLCLFSTIKMVNPFNLLRLLQQKYRPRDYPESPITFEEEDVAIKLFELLEGCRNSSLTIETNIDLDFDDNW